MFPKTDKWQISETPQQPERTACYGHFYLLPEADGLAAAVGVQACWSSVSAQS